MHLKFVKVSLTYAAKDLYTHLYARSCAVWPRSRAADNVLGGLDTSIDIGGTKSVSKLEGG